MKLNDAENYYSEEEKNGERRTSGNGGAAAAAQAELPSQRPAGEPEGPRRLLWPGRAPLRGRMEVMAAPG